MECHVLQKGVPLTLLLLISGEGWSKGIRQFGRDLGLAPFKGRGDCTGQPVVVEGEGLAEEPNVKLVFDSICGYAEAQI